MKLILELEGVEVVIHLKEGREIRGGPNLASQQSSGFLELLAAILADCWLNEQGLRQAA